MRFRRWICAIAYIMLICFLKSYYRSVHLEAFYSCWDPYQLHLVQPAVSWDCSRRSFFLYLTGCEDFFSMTRAGATETGYLYYCDQSNSKGSFFLLSAEFFLLCFSDRVIVIVCYFFPDFYFHQSCIMMDQGIAYCS